jgi:hypothetical protein
MFVIKVALGTFIGILLALYIFPNLPHSWDLTSGVITSDPHAKAEYERELALNREDNASWLRQQREQIVQNR